MGHVVSIGAGQPFVDVLARRMLMAHGDDGDGMLADALVLVPTRRAARSLSEAFLRASDGRALLLPAIRPLGDLEEDDPELGLVPGEAETELPRAIDGTRRQMLLARLIRAWDPDLPVAPALGLASTLADFIDEAITERVSFDALENLVPEQYQAHWQQVLAFLGIVTTSWPAILTEEQAIDPSRRRDLLTAALASAWRLKPPGTPIYIAGSTGSVPATADLMAAVLDLSEGWIVLPGLDLSLDARDQAAALEEAVHPQHGMLTLLHRLQRDPAEVVDWSGAPPGARTHLLREALRPASTTDRWGALDGLEQAALDGLSQVEAPGQHEEALAIALMLRQVLEQPGQTAALVTPDRSLARRVVAEMARYGVELDDSAGRSLRLTRAGSFLQMAAEAVDAGFAPVPLLALLKHPLASGGMDTAAFRREVRRLERQVLRGVRCYETPSQLLTLAGSPDWLKTIVPLAEAVQSSENTIIERFTALIHFVETLAASDAEPGAELLWQGDDGEAAAAAMATLLDAADSAPELGTDPLAPVLDQLIGSATVRPRFGQHPRLSILGPLEARLQSFDLIILGGLNEGIWPSLANADPWMSRPMRADFGLAPPERRTGLQAHDFQQLAASNQVVLTRSRKVDGTPTVASRWWLRLESVATGAGLTLPRDEGPVRWAALLDQPDRVQAVAPPEPRPSIERRPEALSVTRIETLIRDPYAIFAERVLGLEVLDEIDQAPDARQKGTLIHEAFEALAKARPGAWDESLWPQLEQTANELFAASDLPLAERALWWRRLVQAGRWLLRHEGRNGRSVVKRIVEQRGVLKGLSGLPDFTLSATADRLDVMADGSVAIGDYKTGTPPSAKQIEAGLAVQLPLTALIVQAGGFDELGSRQVEELFHIRIHGVGEGGTWIPVKVKDIQALIADTGDGVARLLRSYQDAETPYRSRPHVQFARSFDGDYDHLARVREWSVAGDGDNDGEQG